ncbi:MAG: aminotransferase class V-fold PLP-dependent enzyme, partial [Planctomycetes bacterium]|nr:aminotransferase class V-fold PLP-dependent enzyme [Planctomycetota bacterium]
MPDLEGIYLDNASTSYPKPKAVYEAVSEFALSCGASPGRGAYPRALEAEDMLARCRSDVAKLLGVRNPTRIAFASGSTEALNWAIKGVLTRPGDHAVVTALEHNAVLRPLQWLNRTREVTWSVVPCNDDGHVEPADIAEAIRPETRLLCAVHASNVLGTLLPIRDIVEVAHGRGVPVLVDGSQTAGSVPFSVEDLEIDLFAFTGHKSLLGPPGSGGLYVRPGLEIETWKEGGTGLHSESLDAPLEMPARLEAGTPNTWGLAGLIGGVEWLLHTGVEYVRGHEMHLA